jgi:hypothetical protein
MRHIRIVLLLSIIFLSGCIHNSNTQKYSWPYCHNSDIDRATFFLGDMQLHNIFGTGIKQMSSLSDKVAKVAQRPAELNIIAPFIFENIIEKSYYFADIYKQKKPLTVILGDVTNIACSGEFDSFLKAVNHSKIGKSIFFMAHGNHDSYLLGTVNSYIPTEYSYKKPDIKVGNIDMKQRIMQWSDKSWWNISIPTSNRWTNYNWKHTCYKTGTNSTPMNKLSWIAKYLQLLDDRGINLKFEDSADRKSVNNNKNLKISAVDINPKNRFNYRIEGEWYEPIFDNKNLNQIDFQSASKSFIVQSIDISKKQRLILIDTSICQNARGGLAFPCTNAGMHSCIGESQLEIIDDMVKNGIKSHKDMIFAGHFPLKELKSNERERLIEIMSQIGRWSYISAHTHSPLYQQEWSSGEEYNIASTTDYPMEGYNFYLLNSKVDSIKKFNIGKSPKIKNLKSRYSPQHYRGDSELCRHLPSAKTLSKLDIKIFNRDGYKIKYVDEFKSCNRFMDRYWLKYTEELDGYIQEIERRYRSNKEYKKALLKIGLEASFSEGNSN